MHLTILSQARNSRLVDIVGQLRDQSRLYGLERAAGTHAFLDSTREHDGMLDAIEAATPTRPRAHDQALAAFPWHLGGLRETKPDTRAVGPESRRCLPARSSASW